MSITHDELLALVAAALDTCDDMSDDEKDECFAEMCNSLGVPNAPIDCEEAATG